MSRPRVPRESPRLLSFVLPLYDEEDVVPHLRERLESLAAALECDVEWVLVNDGSRDGTAELLFAWAESDARAKVLDLSRNFGQSAALTAGLDAACGDAVIVMDADLQDPPELAVKMLERYREGYDVVFAQRTKRHGESAFKRASAAAFYWTMRKLAVRDLPANTGEFRLMSRAALDAFGDMREGQRFVRGMTTWIGFPQIAVPFERPPRRDGLTKYPTRKMLRFALDAIFSFSTAPLRLASYLGLTVFFFGSAYGVYTFVRAVLHVDLVAGWPTIVILLCVIGGTILVCLGVIGEYVGRIYEEVKGRPLYIVMRGANLSEAGTERHASAGRRLTRAIGASRDERFD